MRRTYTVRLARPVFEMVNIEVEAMSKGGAVRKALHRASKLGESDWCENEHSRNDYQHHVEGVLDHQSVYETSANPKREILEFRSGTGASQEMRYLLLAADTKAHAGRVLMQPWFQEAISDLQLELCCDWIEPISFIIENDGLEGEDEHSLTTRDDQDEGNVIVFPLDPLEEDASVGS